MLVDSHCHLDFPELAADLDGVLQRAAAADVGTLVTIGTKLSEIDRVLAIAERHDRVWCSVGVHPHEAAVERDAGTARLIELARHPKVVGIGETGLDYYYAHSPRTAQAAQFRAHIAAARETGLPLIVHSRDADEDTAAMLREGQGRGGFRGVIHCFTSGLPLAQTAIELGLYISFSGIVTFKKADDLRRIAAGLPIDRLLVETDAPYLAPVPMRGKRNEPAFVAHTAAALAKLKGLGTAELAEQTTENFFRLFAKAKRP
jgi:TatD DNase family protein